MTNIGSTAQTEVCPLFPFFRRYRFVFFGIDLMGGNLRREEKLFLEVKGVVTVMRIRVCGKKQSILSRLYSILRVVC